MLGSLRPPTNLQNRCAVANVGELSKPATSRIPAEKHMCKVDETDGRYKERSLERSAHQLEQDLPLIAGSI